MFKLGKAPATSDARDLMFAHYRSGSLPPHPKAFGHETAVGPEWGMLGNDAVGDCVFAGAAHETMLWTCESLGRPAPFDPSSVLSDYSAVTGYDPRRTTPTGENPTDNGTNVRDGLRYRQKTGIVDAAGKRHQIGAYVAVELANTTDLLEALYLFGAVGIGLEFPPSAMDQFDRRRPWRVVSGPSGRPDGGHYVPLVGYRDGYLECVTWGRVQRMSLSFFTRYCDEAWAMLSAEMLKDGASLDGFSLADLQKDLSVLKGHA